MKKYIVPAVEIEIMQANQMMAGSLGLKDKPADSSTPLSKEEIDEWDIWTDRGEW